MVSKEQKSLCKFSPPDENRSSKVSGGVCLAQHMCEWVACRDEYVRCGMSLGPWALNPTKEACVVGSARSQDQRTFKKKARGSRFRNKGSAKW